MCRVFKKNNIAKKPQPDSPSLLASPLYGSAISINELGEVDVSVLHDLVSSSSSNRVQLQTNYDQSMHNKVDVNAYLSWVMATSHANGGLQPSLPWEAAGLEFIAPNPAAIVTALAAPQLEAADVASDLNSFAVQQGNGLLGNSSRLSFPLDRAQQQQQQAQPVNLQETLWRAH